jgi:NAD(P)-dependent dehydrogenase (short-subunit alcohol dehydrogenase family)
VSDQRFLLTGEGPLVERIADGLRSRGATLRIGWRQPATRDALSDMLGEMKSELGGIDVIVHLWAHGDALTPCEVESMSEQRWADACESTLDGAYRLAQAAHPHLAASHGRLIYVVPAIAMGGAPGYAAYAAAGEGVRALAKGIAKTWGKYGITVNTLAVNAANAVGAEAATRSASGQSLSPPALGRVGDPASDIAPVVALLADDDAHFVTGSTLVLDGGVWMAL